MRSILLLAIISLAGCATAPILSSNFATVTPDEVLAGLNNANAIEIDLPNDYSLMRKSQNMDDLNWHIDWCNGDDEPGAEGGKEGACIDRLYDDEHISDASILQYDMEILFRSCGVYALSQTDSDEGISCGYLGRLFFQIGNASAARAVWEHAPGCHVQDTGGHPVNGCIDAILGLSSEDGTSDNHQDWTDNINYMGAYASDPQELHKLASDACAIEHDFNACKFVKSQGANINLNSVAGYNQQRIRRNESAEDAAARAAQIDREEHREQVNAVIGALSNLPGANDPNAIVDTANQEAAQMIAVGAANDAARAQATEERNAQEQAAEQQREAQVSSVATSGSDLQNSNAGSSDTSTYTYTHPATDCLSYAADPDTQGILVTNNCKDQVILTWARPAGTHVGLDHAIQGGDDIVPAGGTDSVPPHPVRVFACYWPGTPTKPGQENSSNDWELEYTDTAFTCPALNHAVKTQQ